MNSRERVRAALRHEQPDRVPVDLGGCGQTGINASTLYKLRQAYNLPQHPLKICEPYQLLGEVEQDLLEKVGADVLPLWNPGNLMGTTGAVRKPWAFPDGTPVLMAQDFQYDVTESGDTFVYPQGDRTAAYSLHLPSDGSFFDNINRAPRVDEANLTPLEDFKASYSVHTQQTCEYWQRESQRIYQQTEYSIMGVLGGMGLGDVAELPGPFLKEPKGIRNMEDWLMAHYLHPEYIQAVFEYQTEIMLKNLELYRQAVGERIDSIWLSGTDFGTQNNLFLAPELFRKLYKPFYTKVNAWIHKNTGWKTFYHSCGAVYELIPDFIEMGVDILNPVQCSAQNMNAEQLKKEFGKKITFWGAGINTQATLPYGTAEEVRKEVLHRLEVFSPDGGFVFAAIHNIVAGVPVENIVAMFDAVKEFGGK